MIEATKLNVTAINSKQSQKGLNFAVEEWQTLLGRDRCLLNLELLQELSKSCSSYQAQPLALLLPESLAELQKILHITRKYEVPLYPISRGKNWGYGCATASSSANVLLDLSRMNRIVEVNQELAYAVVEPGVTQAQLFQYLQEKHPDLCMDVTGATPEASLIGNMLERGFGLTPYADRFLNSAGMQILLADGSILNSGFGHFENAAATYLHKWGVGPSLDGLFTQSNFGIVIKVGIWLMLKPKRNAAFVVHFADQSRFIKAVPALRELKLRGLLPSVVHIPNDLRVISTLQNYPYQAMQNLSPLSEDVRADLRRKWGIASWTCFGGLYGSRRRIAADFSEIKDHLEEYGKVSFVSDSINHLLSKLIKIKWLAKILRLSSKIQLLNLINGIPSSAALPGMYWRKRNSPQMGDLDPRRDNCGLLWFSPVIPALSSDCEKFLNITEAIFDRYGFESNLAISLITERALCCTVGIVFDQALERESLRADQCHTALIEAYAREGYVPYRLGSNIEVYRGCLFKSEDTFWKLCQRLKKSLDPDNILAPGRYGLG